MKNQKNYYKILSLVVLTALTTSLTVTATENEYIANEQAPVHLYTLEYNDSITSTNTAELFELLEGKPGDITFKATVGEDEITIGYYGIINSYENLLAEIEEEFAVANEIYATKLSQNTVPSVISSTVIGDLSGVVVDKVTFESNSIPEFMEQNYNLSEKNIVTVSEKNFKLNSTATTFTDRHTSGCKNSLTSPHKGDGHSRYSDGYAWHPDVIQVGFKNNYSSGQNRVEVYYEYYSSTDNLENLQYDSDEGLEVKVTFYNYGSKGTSYIEAYDMDDTAVVWTTNQPTAYLDTLYGNDDELPFCIGVENANKLTTGKFYYWTIRNTAGTDNNKTYDGAFKVAIQRTYEYSSFATWWGSRFDGVPDGVTWERFSEEHEGTILPGVSSNASNNWQNDSAWDYASSHTEWEYNTLDDDPIKLT